MSSILSGYRRSCSNGTLSRGIPITLTSPRRQQEPSPAGAPSCVASTTAKCSSPSKSSAHSSSSSGLLLNRQLRRQPGVLSDHHRTACPPGHAAAPSQKRLSARLLALDDRP